MKTCAIFLFLCFGLISAAYPINNACYENYQSLYLLPDDLLDQLRFDQAEPLLQLDQLIAFACMDGLDHRAEQLIVTLQSKLHSGLIK